MATLFSAQEGHLMETTPPLIQKVLCLNQHSCRQVIEINESRFFVGVKTTINNKWLIYIISLRPERQGRCQVTSVHYILNDIFYLQMHPRQLPHKKVGSLFVSNEMDQLSKYVRYRFKFFISFNEAVGNFPDHLFDSKIEELWTAAVNREFTDIELIVADRTFPAHKAIVAARSPVFGAMFRSDMIESRTNRVNIDDTDPFTFEVFLKFVYTGKLDCSSFSPQLLQIADKYQVESLKLFCQQLMNAHDVEKTLTDIAGMI